MWVDLLKKVQDEIVLYCENPYYKKMYKGEEIQYWHNIAQWIYDCKGNNVTKCLDIGCAYGTLAVYLKELFKCDVYCTDFINKYTSMRLVKEKGLNFKLSNIELDKFPWQNTKFDIIVFTEILEHLNFHPLYTLKKIHEMLDDNGLLFLSTPDVKYCGRTKYYNTIDNIPYPNTNNPIKLLDTHIYVYNKYELYGLFQKAGFRINKEAKTNNRLHFNFELAKK